MLFNLQYLHKLRYYCNFEEPVLKMNFINKNPEQFFVLNPISYSKTKYCRLIKYCNFEEREYK